jgi:hypothetical protein
MIDNIKLKKFINDRFQIYCCGGCDYRSGYFERTGKDLYPRYKCEHPESSGRLGDCPFLKIEGKIS